MRRIGRGRSQRLGPAVRRPEVAVTSEHDITW